jgi:hypothetical protein
MQVNFQFPAKLKRTTYSVGFRPFCQSVPGTHNDLTDHPSWLSSEIRFGPSDTCWQGVMNLGDRVFLPHIYSTISPAVERKPHLDRQIRADHLGLHSF